MSLFTGGIALCGDVGNLVFGVNIFDLDLCVQIDSVKQPIKRDSMGTGHMSQYRTPVKQIFWITASLPSNL